jgi:hypothetical protein
VDSFFALAYPMSDDFNDYKQSLGEIRMYFHILNDDYYCGILVSNLSRTVRQTDLENAFRKKDFVETQLNKPWDSIPHVSIYVEPETMFLEETDELLKLRKYVVCASSYGVMCVLSYF